MGYDNKISTWKIVVLLILMLLCLIGIAGLAIERAYTVTEVSVTGNQHYTVQQIEDIVMSGRFGHNSLYLSLKYRNKAVEDIPFVETMDVEILSPSSISITVYEKAIAGCIEYLDRYMYFDKDGVVVEAASYRAEDLPYITGLHFNHVVLYEKLTVDDDEIFREILTITQLLSKYDIHAGQIYFDKNRQITLFFGDAKVLIGSVDSIDEKMQRLQGIVPKLEGKKGTLYLDNYDSDNGDAPITFQRADLNEDKELFDLSSIMFSGETVSSNEIPSIPESVSQNGTEQGEEGKTSEESAEE